MGVEIEKKYRISPERRDRIEELLNEYGATFEGEDFEENAIYGGGTLEERRAVLRIRRTSGRSFLTFKQRIATDLDVKHQTEHETEIGDADEMAEIVRELGFVTRVVYEKRRRTWKFRSVEVVLDELPFGFFMEIEGTLTTIAEAEMLLEAEDLEAVGASYPSLTWNHGARVGDLVEARFPQKE